MPYTNNPKLPKVRFEAAKLVLNKGWSTREVSRYTGYNQSTIVRWVNILKKEKIGYAIPTKSSRPHFHPKQLSQELVKAILEYRQKHQRCAEVLHYLLRKDGYDLSLSSVKRTLKRSGLTRFSKWKKWHQYPPKPIPKLPGTLVEIDTIVDGHYLDRLYIYTLLDINSRWGFALPIEKIGAGPSFRFIQKAVEKLPFKILTLQSDHGSEFSKDFTKKLLASGFQHRHTRVRTPTDNGHLERFNRTIQEECLKRVPKTLEAYSKAIPEYLNYYNFERPHMGLQMKTPAEVMQSY